VFSKLFKILLIGVITASLYKPLLLAAEETQNRKKEENSSQALDTLFFKLRNAKSLAEAQTVEQIIWSKWKKYKDPSLSEKLELGIRQMHNKNLKKALVTFTKIIEEAPDFSEALNKRATTYFLLQEYQASLLDIKATLTLEPRHFGAISGMGLIFMKSGEYRRSLMAFRKVLEIYPLSISAKVNIELIGRKLNLKSL
jgi:tetratricopeptide (TPR) repeat protein